MEVRTAAFKLLQKTFKEEGFSNYLYESALSKNPEWTETDRRFLKALYFGVLREMYLLDHLTSTLYKGDFAKLPESIKIILRLGMYQIMSMDKVPPYALINEAVKLAKKVGHQGTAKLVNALLRRGSKDKETLVSLLDNIRKNNDVKGISLSMSHPEWLVKKYVAEHGLERTIAILEANNQIPAQNFRVRDTGKLEQFRIPWELKIEKNQFNKVGVSFENPDNSIIEKLKSDKVVASQDQSSLIAVSLLEGAEGRVLELCCVRGNKTEPMLKYIDNKAVIINADLSVSKLLEMKYQFSSAKGRCFSVCCDVLKPLPFIEKYKYIFLDAPCSGLGVVRRHPEIKYHQSPEKITQMADIQFRILTNAALNLEKNGALIYSVCSFEREETLTIIERFLAENPDFSKIDIGQKRPDLAQSDLIFDGFLRILPGKYGMDGFFTAMLTRS
jgi:16S rRNA (cytosine967-C5)-methyltransferase